MAEIPKWADDLTTQVCKDYKRSKPEIRWHNSSQNILSSGHTHYGKTRSGRRMFKWNGKKFVTDWGHVSVTAGSHEQDQELVLLHELAHWIVGRNKTQSHSRKFWDLAFDLYEKYGVDMQYAYTREKNYKQGAVLAYERRTKK